MRWRGIVFPLNLLNPGCGFAGGVNFTWEGFVEGNSVPDVFILQMIELYTQGRFPFDQLINVYCFDEINEAVADLQHGKTIKAVLDHARFPDVAFSGSRKLFG